MCVILLYQDEVDLEWYIHDTAESVVWSVFLQAN